MPGDTINGVSGPDSAARLDAIKKAHQQAIEKAATASPSPTQKPAPEQE